MNMMDPSAAAMSESVHTGSGAVLQTEESLVCVTRSTRRSRRVLQPGGGFTETQSRQRQVAEVIRFCRSCRVELTCKEQLQVL